jgi:1,4-alpha-glucan branching enzyme
MKLVLSCQSERDLWVDDCGCHCNRLLEAVVAEVFITDSERYGGSNLGNLGGKFTEEWGIHGYEHSLDLCLPPLSVLVFSRDEKRSQEVDSADLSPM